MRTLAVVPARYRSKRFPGKPLAGIDGRCMIEHVYRRVTEAELVDRVLVATDDDRIRDRVHAFGGDCVMTSPEHPSGTDRVAEAAKELDFEIVVNVQGDEPLIKPRAIDQAVSACKENGGRAMISLRRVITSARELWDPNVVKVVTDRRGFALYFSRWPIPFVASFATSVQDMRNRLAQCALPTEGSCYKHIGLYVYPKELLLELAGRDPTPLESLERLEQLRALEQGIPIRMVVTDYDNVAVDTPTDLERVRRILSRREPRQ
jgi:3-deoxy-manno-octulosonate cytidylyltransferase (CMP-KDO synthetase)